MATDQIRSASDSEDSGHRIAIIGGGPRGLYCLQALVDQLLLHRSSRASAQNFQIDVFEPCEYPGAGNVYDPRQPAYLRMNFSARHIDAWSRDLDLPSHATALRLNLCQWLQQMGRTEFSEHSFIPRALTGQYLHHCFRLVQQLAETVATVSIHRESVKTLTPQQDGWLIVTPSRSFQADQVALTVGHEGWRPPAEADDTVNWIPAFPAAENLHTDQIPPGSTVVMRGFGLTAIDAILTLTEGRGGRFRQRGHRWSYRRSGDEPKCVIPFSRTGRPMLAKPDESLFVPPDSLSEIWQHGRERIGSVRSPVTQHTLLRVVWPMILDAARGALACVRTDAVVRADNAVIDRWFQLWTSSSMQANESLESLRYSYQVATATAPAGIAWALGAAWRGLYPALVRLVSHGGLVESAWPQFRSIACEMERLAFGPPAENVGRLLALVDAGLVELNQLGRSGAGIESGASPETRYVDAVLPSPHQQRAGGPVSKLIQAGWIERLPGADGVHVDAHGRPVLSGDSAPSGLAIFGRVTEGCVLGNDTLSRRLHKHPVRWAASLVRRVGQRETL